MMEQVYALGVHCIGFIQYCFSGYEGYLESVNDFSNPQYIMDYLIPLISIVDSVFSAQLLLCMAFGGWLNTILKWWLLEDRPYWWVRRTSFYSDIGEERPSLYQTHQTCETGPGSPSGHSTTSAMLLVLFVMWTEHVLRDRNLQLHGWRQVVYALFGFVLGSVMVARMYVATHFPHQCLIGGAVGAFLAPALCIYITDPYIWGYPPGITPTGHQTYHLLGTLAAISIGLITYYSLVCCGVDPHYTVKLAFRWCRYPENINVSTTPVFSLVQSCASLLGWAVFVTPKIGQYRHDTKSRSLLISTIATAVIMYFLNVFESNINRDSTLCFYSFRFILYAIKPFLFLRLTPSLAKWPYRNSAKLKAE